MKSIVTIYFLLTALLSGQLSAQSNKSFMEVSYRMKFFPDSLNLERSITVDNLILLFNDNSSVYFSKEARDYFTQLKNGVSSSKNGNISLGVLPSLPKSRGSVYKSGEVITATLPVGRYFYSFEEPKLLWALLDEKTKINGIDCRLAKTLTDTGDTFFAWYTMEYPYSEGPFRFKGLPGLIIKVYNKNNTISIEATNLKETAESIEPFFNDGSIELKTKSIFLKQRKDYNDNPNIQNMNSNVTFRKDGVLLDNATSMKKIENNVFLD
ncbi:GLPGLI family protein [Chryseobacterium sp. Leaf180]|uniref:GLPGLI family protein n=1 Tax=Chryseobacterium sp. Leaf180 TaxID=1736289 RepID=UPI000B0DC7BC|nr:GLPGLI family protein [Chryseobacterium sp. Leaf180]